VEATRFTPGVGAGATGGVVVGVCASAEATAGFTREKGLQVKLGVKLGLGIGLEFSLDFNIKPPECLYEAADWVVGAAKDFGNAVADVATSVGNEIGSWFGIDPPPPPPPNPPPVRITDTASIRASLGIPGPPQPAPPSAATLQFKAEVQNLRDQMRPKGK
jgi:hypothetical protein